MMPTLWGPTDWFSGIIGAMVGFFLGGAKYFLGSVIKVMFFVSLPSPSELWSSWFVTNVGGMLGLALMLWKFLVILIGLVVILGSTRRLSEKRRMQISRLGSSLALLSLFSIGFFPVYGWLYRIEQGLERVMLSFITGGPTNGGVNDIVNTLMNVITPGNAAAKLFASLVTWVFSLTVLIESGLIFLITISTLIFYPLAIAVRPLGRAGNSLFNAANAAIAVTLLSPPIMAGALLLPIAVSKIHLVGDLGILQLFAALGGGLIAAWTPIGLATFFYHKSSEMFGYVDANVAGRLDIDSMPPVTVEGMEESLEETHTSAIGDFAKTVGNGAIYSAVASDDSGEFFSNMKNIATDAAGAAAAASGHPWVGMLVNLSNDKSPDQPGADDIPHN